MLGLLGNPGLSPRPTMPDWVHHTQAKAHTVCPLWSAAEQGAGYATVLFHPWLALRTSAALSEAGWMHFSKEPRSGLLIQLCRGVWESIPGRPLSLLWHSAQLRKGQRANHPCCSCFENVTWMILVCGTGGIMVWVLLHWYMMHAWQARAASELFWVCAEGLNDPRLAPGIQIKVFS